jgi:hypothetical protein
MSAKLLTGLPRSGTTLICACLNELPDCIALVEPMTLPTPGDIPRLMGAIDAFIADTRKRALTEGKTRTKTTENTLAFTNTFAEPTREGVLRREVTSISDVAINKQLTPDFALFIKYPNLFMAVWEQLQERFPVYGVVRHPLAVLASWQTVDTYVRDGHVPVVEAYVPALKRELAAIAAPLDRQLVLLRWYFGNFDAFPRKRVIRYEDLTADPAGTLAQLHPKRAPIKIVIREEPPDKRHPSVDVALLARRLLPLAPHFKKFYPDFAESLSRYISPGAALAKIGETNV